MQRNIAGSSEETCKLKLKGIYSTSESINISVSLSLTIRLHFFGPLRIRFRLFLGCVFP